MNIRPETAPRRPLSYSDRDGFVYFISDGEAVKIGWSVAPEVRIATLQTSCPRKLRLIAKFPGSEKDEGRAHAHFKHLRMEGEWFRHCDEITHFIKMAKADNETIENVIRRREETSRGIVSRATVPESPDKFKSWADAACVTWSGPLQVKACEAWDALKNEDRAPFDAFCAAYQKEVQVG